MVYIKGVSLQFKIWIKGLSFSIKDPGQKWIFLRQIKEESLTGVDFSQF